MLFKDKNGEKEITTAYCGGKGTTNSFSRFGKKTQILNQDQNDIDKKKNNMTRSQEDVAVVEFKEGVTESVSE